MASVTLPITVSVNIALTEQAILKAIAAKFAKALRSGYEGALRARIGNELEMKMKLTPEYIALTTRTNQLGAIGLVNSVAAIEGILAGLRNAMMVQIQTPTVVGRSIRGGAKVGISRKDYQDVLQAPLSTFPSEKGHSVDWLSWMLFGGDSIVVPDYSFDDRKKRGSRTGIGVMIKTGKGWHVPDPLAGTIGDNWMTQLMNGISPIVETIMIEEFKRRL